VKILAKLASELLAFQLVVCLASVAIAQSTTGSIYGTVVDTTGAVVPNASVTLTNVHTNVQQTTTCNGAGEYTFAIVNPGDYTVSSSAQGFKTQTQTGISLSANQNVHVPFTLSVGQVQELVEVQADVTLIDTREGQLAETIDQAKIESLPTLNRDVYSLLTITPGITNYSADKQIGSRDGARFSSNGLPNDMESFYLDGAYDNVYKQNGGSMMPNPDALQEFRVLSSNFDAEFGRAPAAVVNAITKSGTEHYHGDLYDFIRNNVLNARNYFVSASLPPVQLIQNQFGVTAGGPAKILPKTFFFLSYQGLQLRSQNVINSGVIQTLTAAERKGDFSQDTASNVFGTTGTFKKPTLPAGTNCGTAAAPKICAAALDPVAQAALAFMPVGSDPAPGVFNHTSTQQVAQAGSVANEGLGRIDYAGLTNHLLEAMFYNSHGTAIDHALGGNQTLNYVAMNDHENQSNAVIADTWTLSSKAVNSFRGFYMQNRYILSNFYPDHFIQNLGSQMAPGGNAYAPSRFNLNTYVSMSNAGIGPSDIDQMQFGGVDTMNMTRGRHVIKVGGSYVWSKYQEQGANAAGGNLSFTGTSTGNTFADFLLGKANNLNQTNATFHRLHQYDPSLFVQDDWQITGRLNLNLGVRWEAFPPYAGDAGLGTFKAYAQSTLVPSAPLGLLYQGDSGVPNGLFHTSYLNFAPRVGFAFDAFGNGKTSVRGGFGIFYFMPSLNNNTGGQINPPYALSVSTAQLPNLVCPYGLASGPLGVCPAGTPIGAGYGDPFPYDHNQPKYQNPAAGSNVSAVPINGGSTPYVYEYNLTLEQQLSPRTAFHMAYVGNAMRKNYITIDENAPVYSPGASTTVAGLLARRPYNPSPSTFRFGSINLEAPIENGAYNSLQTTLRANYGRNFSMLASYVWSKSLNYGGAVVDNYDIRKNFGAADVDLRHNFVVSYSYTLPETRGLGWVSHKVLNGWRFSGITAIQSGNPFTITSGVDTNLDGTTNDRVDVVGNPYLGGHRTRAQKIAQYINPAAFAIPGGPYGNEQKNQLFGPANVRSDLALAKEIPLFEIVRFHFRAESFNVFGNVNLNNPRTALNNLQQTSLNQITGAGPARQIQFAAKILF
jgi:hypothetical protein